MPNSYAQIPYGTAATGISIQYGDSVPESAVNLAYVQTAVPSVADAVDIEDDLSDAGKYAGNTIAAAVRTLQITSGQIIDPANGNLWTAQTDNVLFTTVTAGLADATGAVVQIPLFYSQRPRYGVPLTTLPPALAARLATGLTLNETQFPTPEYAALASLVSIQTSSGATLPRGYVFNVLPYKVEAGQLYITVYTNFQSTFNHRFLLTWGANNETLNVHPCYFQHRSKPDTNVYVATTVVDDSVGALLKSAALAGGSSTAQIVTGGGTGSTNQLRSAPVSNVSAPSISSQSTSAPTSQAIALTTENPYYVNGPAGFATYPAPPLTYQTGASMTAPRDSSVELTLTFDSISVQNDANGQGTVLVTLYDPTGIPVKTFAPLTAPQTLTYSDPGASAGVYTWSVRASVNDFKGIQAGVPQGTYTYSVSWSGHLGWFIPTTTTYANNVGAPTRYATPAATNAPSPLNPLSLQITGINTPLDPYGATAYSVTLYDPTGTQVQNWTGVTATQTLYYPAQGVSSVAVGPGGQYTWMITATCASNQTGTSQYACSMQAMQNWYITVPGAASVNNNQDGTPVSYITGVATIAPTNPNSALTLNLANVTVQQDANGNSALKVQLVDPTGRIVKTWANITQPKPLTYSNLAAPVGQWTWNVWTTCTNNGLTLSTYTGTWTGTHTWHEHDPAAVSAATQRTIGFTFSVGTSDGVVYATTDDGPQVFVQQPDNLSADENWYLRLHRGWLSYTDPAGATYLVGIEPYYRQNFNGMIPIVSLRAQRAQIQNTTTVRVVNTPILVDPAYPIDVIVTRTSSLGHTDLWITRDNQTSNGAYVPSAIADIDAARGTITLSSFYLQSNDAVHVKYSYLEYYLAYRGFVDGFGRFVHLDVNPSGGHTWMNLWNIANATNTLSGSGTSTASITSSVASVATLVPHNLTVNASGTATITRTTQGSTANVGFSASASQTASLAIAGQTATSVVATTITSSDTSSAALAAQQQSTFAPAEKNVNANFVGTIEMASAAESIPQTTPRTQQSNVAGTPSVTATTSSTYSRTDSGWVNFTTKVVLNEQAIAGGYRHTWTYDPTAVVTAPFQVDQAPADVSSAIITSLRNMAFTTAGGTAAVSATEFPWNSTNHKTGAPLRGLPGPYFDLIANVISPATGAVPTGFEFNQHELSTLNDVSFTDFLPGIETANPAEPFTGQYKLQIYPVAQMGSTTWDDTTSLGTVTYTLTGQYKVSAITATTATYYSFPAAAVQTFKTSSITGAPIDTNSQLTLALSSVVAPTDSAGTSSFNVTLTAPNGQVVRQQTGITGAQSIAYSSATALPGAYTWSVWASVAGHQSGSSNYPCTANVTYTWLDQSTSYNYLVSIENPTSLSLSTSSLTLAPTTVASQLSLVASAGLFQSDGFGNAIATVQLTDPNGQLCSLTAGVQQGTMVNINGPTTITYYAPGAIAGTYTWSLAADYQESTSLDHGKMIYAMPANRQPLQVSFPIVLGWEENLAATTYSYVPVDGIARRYPMDAGTVAPIDAGHQLQLNLTAVNCPTDSHGSSSLTVQLLNPSGQVVQSATGITAPQPITYSAANAPGGRYVWVITAKATGNGTGASSYTCSYTGTLTSQTQVSKTTYSPVTSPTATFATPASTLAPTAAGTQLSFNVAQAVLPTSGVGTTAYHLTLTAPNSTVVFDSGSVSTPGPHVYTYNNAGAAAGIYTWTLTTIATPSSVGSGTLSPVVTGAHGWFQSVTTNSAVSTQADGAAQTFTVNATAAPDGSAAAKKLSLQITSATCFSDANGQGAMKVWLTDPSSATLQTWIVNHADTLSWSAGGAVTGTYTWHFAATASNPNTGAGSYASSLAGVLTWPQTDSVPTTTYTPVSGTVYTYKTGQFTVAPTNTATQLTAAINGLNLPTDAFGTCSILVKLLDPHGSLLQTWAGLSTSQVIKYSDPAAIAGQYTWQVYGVVNPTNRGTGSYPVQWGIDFGWFEGVDNEVATVELVTRALYLYLTVDGHPFHAVLDPLNDPNNPFLYDTNHALAGTRYASMPTIHAF